MRRGAHATAATEQRASPPLRPVQVYELSLSANQLRSDVHRLEFEAGDTLGEASGGARGQLRSGRRSALAGGGAPGMRTGDQAKEEELQHLRLGAEIIDCR